MSAVPEHGLLSLGTSELIQADTTRSVQCADTDVLGILLSVSWVRRVMLKLNSRSRQPWIKMFFALI